MDPDHAAEVDKGTAKTAQALGEAAPEALDQLFKRAADKVSKASFPDTSSENKLQLYGLYKQTTQGSCSENGVSRPSIMDPVGRAKYDAWASCHAYEKPEAQFRYVSLVQEIDPSFVFITNIKGSSS